MAAPFCQDAWLGGATLYEAFRGLLYSGINLKQTCLAYSRSELKRSKPENLFKSGKTRFLAQTGVGKTADILPLPVGEALLA